MNYIILCLMGALMFSVSDLFTKYVLNNGMSNINYIFWSRGITYLICLILLVVLTYLFSIKFLANNSKNDNIYELIKLNKRKDLNYACIISGILSLFAIILIIYSFSVSKNIGYNVAIVSSTCLFTLIISSIFLKTKIELQGLMGCILIILGVFLISRTNNN